MPTISAANRSLGTPSHISPRQVSVDWMHPEYNPHVVYWHASNLTRQQQAVQTRENLTSTRRTSIKQYANRPVHILEAKPLQAVHNRANITFTRKTQIKKFQQQTCRHLQSQTLEGTPPSCPAALTGPCHHTRWALT